MPEYPNITAIKTDYDIGHLGTRAALLALTRLFSCLRDLYPKDYDPEINYVKELAATALKLSSGEAECVKFCLMIYNWHLMTDPHAYKRTKWKCGLFNLATAADKWGSVEKGILTEWINAPFFL